jgi:ornithine cyclodeaminase/alanine dehydrogenase-like protein (mu-crystallin family)
MADGVLVITRQEIEDHIDIRDCLPLVENAFSAAVEGNADLPTKYHYFGSRGLWFFMGGVVEPLGAMAIKLGNVRPENVERGLPGGSSQVIYYDYETAEPLALMSGGQVTALRTGAAAAVGTVGWTSLAALTATFALEKVYAADASAAASSDFVDKGNKLYAFPVVEASAEEAVRTSDIIVTATPAREPIVQRDWVSAGTHISAIGADSPGKQELEASILNEAIIACDKLEQCLEYGEIHTAYRAGSLDKERVIGEIGEIILEKKQGRTSSTDITLFDSTGMGIQDAAVAKLIYETAVRKELGTRVQL